MKEEKNNFRNKSLQVIYTIADVIIFKLSQIQDISEKQACVLCLTERQMDTSIINEI